MSAKMVCHAESILPQVCILDRKLHILFRKFGDFDTGLVCIWHFTVKWFISSH